MDDAEEYDAGRGVVSNSKYDGREDVWDKNLQDVARTEFDQDPTRMIDAWVLVIVFPINFNNLNTPLVIGSIWVMKAWDTSTRRCRCW